MSTKKKYVDAGDINLDEEEIYVDGERLTEERAGKLGRELADRTHTRRQAGRPSLATGVSPQIAFRVPAVTRDQLDQVATKQRRPTSAVAREALEEYLASHTA